VRGKKRKEVRKKKLSGWWNMRKKKESGRGRQRKGGR
jgi:hypothetical protein